MRFVDLRVPAFTAYTEPDPDRPRLSEPRGITRWSDPRDKIHWFGEIKTPGPIEVGLGLQLPAGAESTLRMTVAGQKRTATATKSGALSFGTVQIAKPGYQRFTLEGVARNGPVFGDLIALLLGGPAAANAHFNLKERRNAASVHLGYPIPDDAKAVWFTNEITVKTDPIWSYYMACGFRRGYFGIQVNSPTERRIIFSVWDSGNEAVDRAKVAADDRVQLLAKGDGVVADSFGNEGTGGHSHLVYPWKTGSTYRFLVTAEPDGTHTTYSGWFFFPETRAWGLIARFRAPKDGTTLRGLYSFNENFGGANGQQERRAEFGPAWIKTVDGVWTELTTARFTHDPTGREDRKDYGAGVAKSGRFYLSNGGFRDNPHPVVLGDTFKRSATRKAPTDIVLKEKT